MFVILDTNFLLIPYQYKINIIKEIERLINEPYELVVPERVIWELKRMLKTKKRSKFAARLALEMIEKNKIKIIPSEGYVDDFIVNFCKRNRCVVCTNDYNLKKRLKGIRIISMRSRASIGFV